MFDVFCLLRELEDYVVRLQRSSAPSTKQLAPTLREVEDGAVNLRRVGEALALLKGLNQSHLKCFCHFM